MIGDYAVGYHGYPRATGDMDNWVAINPANAAKLVDVLREFGFDDLGLSETVFLEENRITRMGYPPVRIEVTTAIPGVDFDDCYAERIVELLDGIKVNIISLARLKQNKKASGRSNPLPDLENLS